MKNKGKFCSIPNHFAYVNRCDGTTYVKCSSEQGNLKSFRILCIYKEKCCGIFLSCQFTPRIHFQDWCWGWLLLLIPRDFRWNKHPALLWVQPSSPGSFCGLSPLVHSHKTYSSINVNGLVDSCVLFIFSKYSSVLVGQKMVGWSSATVAWVSEWKNRQVKGPCLVLLGLSIGFKMC